jgi:hypothetical protein
MSGLILNAVKTQLPMLIEKFEPQIQAGLRASLKTMKAQHPEQAALFLTNWNKLNAAVNSELAPPPVGAPPMGARRRVKRTRRNKRSSK